MNEPNYRLATEAKHREMERRGELLERAIEKRDEAYTALRDLIAAAESIKAQISKHRQSEITRTSWQEWVNSIAAAKKVLGEENG